MGDLTPLTDAQLAAIGESLNASRQFPTGLRASIRLLLDHSAALAARLAGWREAVLNVGNERDDLFNKLAATRNQLAAAQATISELRPEVLKFAQAMERQLRANDHKGTWKYDAPDRLCDRIKDELDELEHVLPGLPFYSTTGTPDEILKEAADVANFAMMVADVSGALAPPTPEADDAR